MPLTFDSWFAGGSSLVATQYQSRAAIQWSRILDKPTDVVFTTAERAKLDPQTVRLEYDSTASDATTESGVAGVRKLTIFGIHGHPDLDDTDVGPGYRFNFEDRQYTVIDVIHSIGVVQARCEATG